MMENLWTKPTGTWQESHLAFVVVFSKLGVIGCGTSKCLPSPTGQQTGYVGSVVLARLVDVPTKISSWMHLGDQPERAHHSA
jgi:hypothetical protein